MFMILEIGYPHAAHLVSKYVITRVSVFPALSRLKILPLRLLVIMTILI